MIRKVLLAAVFGFAASTAVQAAPVTYNGITFPAGDISFADEVVSYTVGSGGVNAIYQDPDSALGAPDYPNGTPSTGHATLGAGGTIVLKFTNNALTGSNSAAHDLHIFEVGPDVEDTFVWISIDGTDWLDVGKVFGATSSIDIDPFLLAAGLDPFTQFFYVMLQDDPNEGQTSGASAGADIDAVGAISTVRVITDVPAPGVLSLLGVGLAGLGLFRRRRG